MDIVSEIYSKISIGSSKKAAMTFLESQKLVENETDDSVETVRLDHLYDADIKRIIIGFEEDEVSLIEDVG